MKIKAVGIDLAKNVFQIHCVDEQGKVLLRKQPKRSQVATRTCLWCLREADLREIR